MGLYVKSLAELLRDVVRGYVSRRLCWCGRLHRPGRWHDPTHGRIDRDIQDRLAEQFGPFVTDAERAQRVAIENTVQDRRNRERGRAR